MRNATSTAELKHLPVFLLTCFAVFIFGGLFPPGEWYQSLNRAPWSPPNIAFPIVWAALYICIAIAGWRIFATSNKRLKTLWCLQLLLNALWSWLFFGQQQIDLALMDIVLLLALVITMITLSRRKGLHLVSYLLIPYALWLALATSLNTYILFNN